MNNRIFTNAKDQAANAAGEMIVEGTKEKIKRDISEHWKEYALIAGGFIGALAGANILFNVINRPRPQRVDMHFYVHILTK